MAEENVIVVSFEEEAKAYQAASVLRQADAEGRIDVHAVTIVQRMEDGTLRVKEGEVEDFPAATWTATAIGAATGGIIASPLAFWVDHWGFCREEPTGCCLAPWSTSAPRRKRRAYSPRWPGRSSQVRRR